MIAIPIGDLGMQPSQEDYDSMEIGQIFVCGTRLVKKMFSMPGTVSMVTEDLGEATIEDAEKYPYFEGVR